ncbi:TM1812 family CRISPR-associated protein [Ruminococcus flavefaciens]|uniref:TM1812 family CRISPR-associated protein n=1 Tax=Ruminococcus flavefaciens TaxID=1265 RepID=UPI0004642923|nr:TM1812 family CRISPR-associated protein [Ruminococcus flavefaciens]
MRNIIITNISALPQKEPQINSYTSDIGEFTGKYTNEAPIKYLMSYLNNKREKADIIIAVRTAEANSAYTLFEEAVRAYADEISSSRPEMIPIDTSETELEKTIDAIISHVNENDKVLIDTTGGFRNSSYLLMAVVRFLEYAGIGLTKAIYAKFHDERKIIDITDTYRMFDLINAVNTFSIMGNSRELESYFANQDNEVVKQTIAAMNSFSDEISLCRTSKLDTVLKTLNDRLNELSELHTDSKDVILLKSLSEKIRNKFGCNNKIEYPDVVKWCLDNRLIQQAVTIYVEKMPEYLFSTKVLSYDPKNINTGSFQKNFDIYYNLLYNGLLRLTSSITFSQYPVGNLLLRLKRDNSTVYREICTVNNINDLSIKNQLTQDERRGILNLIRVKNAIFSEPNVRRTVDDIESKKQNTKLRDFADTDIFEIMATTTEAFVNVLLKEKEYIRLLQGEFTPYAPRVWTAADINVVEHLERVLSENKDMYSFSSEIDYNYIKELLRHLIYVKRYVRNALNHASEERHVTDEYDEYFRGMGYNVSAELSVTEIEPFLRKAVDLIIKITY